MSARSYLEELRGVVDNFIDDVNDALQTLRSIRTEVKETHKNCNISKTVGTSVKAVGTIGLIAGILFPPVAIASGIAMAAGTATNVTTEFIRKDKNEYVFPILLAPMNV